MKDGERNKLVMITGKGYNKERLERERVSERE
jgi:hypothetical protein